MGTRYRDELMEVNKGNGIKKDARGIQEKNKIIQNRWLSRPSSEPPSAPHRKEKAPKAETRATERCFCHNILQL
jgi:hypothetical protein